MDEDHIFSEQDVIEDYGVHPDACQTLPDGQLVFHLQIWRWTNGTLHNAPERNSAHNKWAACKKSGHHYINHWNKCSHCGSTEL